MYAGKPIIGIAGGIGSGKSFIARLFGELGAQVIDSDAQVRQAYLDPEIKAALREGWGDDAFLPSGEVDRKFIAGKVFKDSSRRFQLEHLIHPWVDAARRREMTEASKNANIVAFVWDTPLLFETGLDEKCDYVVFVDTPADLRLARVSQTRGWDSEELQRRENLQWPLDRKREISDHVLSNTADAAQSRDQVRDLFPRILAQVAQQSANGGRFKV